jgi:hypothetical protein
LADKDDLIGGFYYTIFGDVVFLHVAWRAVVFYPSEVWQFRESKGRLV